MSAAAGWYPDPTSRFDVRYWSGDFWTEHVVRDGAQTIDALHQEPPTSGKPVGEGSSTDMGFDWGPLTLVLTSEGGTEVSSWGEFREALDLYALRREGLIGIGWSTGMRQVRCYLLGGAYAVDVKKWRDGIVHDVWASDAPTVEFEFRQIDEDVLDGWLDETRCALLSPDRACAVARQWMETETVPVGYALRPMARTEAFVPVDDLPTLDELIQQRRAEREAERQAERARALGLSERGPRPEPLPYGVSDTGAEVLIRDWMRHLGAVDSEVTRASRDGGVDVISSGYIAQVKNYRGSVGVPEIRELFGIAQHDGRTPLFFTSGAFTAEAVRFADTARVALIVYDAASATLVGANESGADVLRTGLWCSNPHG
jgi:hypothetical protein